MNKFIKKEVLVIEMSGIRQFNQLANNVNGAIKLTIGELDFDTPLNIKQKAIEAINDNKTRYTANKGILKLRERISSKYNYDCEEVILTVGTTEGLSIVLKSIISANDEVIIPTPGYVGYKPLITLEQGIVKEVDITKTNNQITLEGLNDAFTSNTKALLTTSPNNPTGKVLSLEEMTIIKDFVLEHNLLLISDEIYSDIIFTKHISFADFPELKQNLVLLNGFSKSHAMTGFRIGYIVSNLELINEFVKVHQYSVTSTSTISQYAALEAIDFRYDLMIDTLKQRRDKVLSVLDSLGISYIKPNGAFYVFYDISNTKLTSYEYAIRLLNEHKVALIPGTYFLGQHDQYVRLSYAVDDVSLDKALEQIVLFHKSF